MNEKKNERKVIHELTLFGKNAEAVMEKIENRLDKDPEMKTDIIDAYDYHGETIRADFWTLEEDAQKVTGFLREMIQSIPGTTGKIVSHVWVNDTPWNPGFFVEAVGHIDDLERTIRNLPNTTVLGVNNDADMETVLKDISEKVNADFNRREEMMEHLGWIKKEILDTMATHEKMLAIGRNGA